ncbi:MAG: hypothetical protein RIR00_433 [Pseudomonadota bacterium]|jgi:general secretion pathway protein G
MAEPGRRLSPGRCRGFSLIELVAVLVILAILAAAAMPLAQLSARRAKEQELKLHLRTIREAIDAYKRAGDEGRIARRIGESGFPKTLEELADGIEDKRDPKQGKIYFLRSVPTDPFAPDELRGSQSWALRSYASPPEDPKPGDDIYDVHSRSPETGLNGIPYRQW